MKKLKCPRCKKEINKDDVFCKECGNPLGIEKKHDNQTVNHANEKEETNAGLTQD